MQKGYCWIELVASEWLHGSTVSNRSDLSAFLTQHTSNLFSLQKLTNASLEFALAVVQERFVARQARTEFKTPHTRDTL